MGAHSCDTHKAPPPPPCCRVLLEPPTHPLGSTSIIRFVPPPITHGDATQQPPQRLRGHVEGPRKGRARWMSRYGEGFERARLQARALGAGGAATKKGGPTAGKTVGTPVAAAARGPHRHVQPRRPREAPAQGPPSCTNTPTNISRPMTYGPAIRGPAGQIAVQSGANRKASDNRQQPSAGRRLNHQPSAASG